MLAEGLLKIGSFQDRNLVLFRATKSIQRSGFKLSRFMLEANFGQAPQEAGRAIIQASPAVLGEPNPERQATISELLNYYFAYGKVELNWAQGTLQSNADGMRWIIRSIGDIPPGRITPNHVLLLKADCAKRGVGSCRIRTFLAALKSFLRFCQLAAGIETMDVRQIRGPKIPKGEVLFLTPEEIQQFVAAIPIRTSPRRYDLKWLCFRTLVEVLLGTGMRISEALSLKRNAINFHTGEATIIGKGNKERVVFFSPRSLP